MANSSNPDRSKFRSFLILFLLSYVLVYQPAQAQQEYFPDSDWERKDAKSVGINKKKLDEAVDYAKQNEYSGARDLRIAILKSFAREPYHEIVGPVKERGGPVGLIIKDGYIIAEWGDTERVDMTFSVTKSYLSTVAGLASDQGLIEVNDTVARYVWGGTFEGRHNSKITWNHLLTQSSDWSGDLFDMKDWADRPPREGGIDDWKNRTLLEPGTNFEYNDVRVNLLAYSLIQVWRKPLPSVLKERIMDPIGASTTWRWYGYDNSWVNVDGIKMQSVSGGGHSGGGVFINTKDHARFGLLFLRNGMWKDKQLISKEWVESVQVPSKANESYGYMWWLNKGNRKMEGVSESVYYAAGFGGNYIVIDKENQLVIVTRWLEPSKLGEFLRLLSSSL
ncbi:MAG: CubicO group peptidase (beta-lactamase class C family) [Cyclobacteriaceae bacterium]|jgi:CubicO group peptidase (beta-lactamase class C family)